MLVLSRKKEESLIIGNNIKITILGVGKETVKLGISAPPEVGIYRKELYDIIHNENIEIQNKKSNHFNTLKKLFSRFNGRPNSKT